VLWGAAGAPAAEPPILALDAGGHTAIVRKVLFTPDGKELITVSDDNTIRFWVVATAEPLRGLRPPIGPGPEGILYAAALSPDGRTLAVGGVGGDGSPGAGAQFGTIYPLDVPRGAIVPAAAEGEDSHSARDLGPRASREPIVTNKCRCRQHEFTCAC
jgi:hypothetical protein